MGKTIKALKRNRKKYQEGGEVVLSPEELMQQASNEVNQLMVDDFTGDPRYDNIAKEAQKTLNEQKQKSEPALLEQTEKALAGPPSGVPVVTAEPQSAPTSLLETPAAPAPAIPTYDPAKDGGLREWAIGQQLDVDDVTPQMVIDSFNYSSGNSMGRKATIDAAKDKLKQQFPKAYAQAFPAEAAAEPEETVDGVRPYSPKNESLKNYLTETGTEITAELIKQNLDYLVSTNSRGEPYQREKFLTENPDLYYEAYPQEKPFDAASETLDNYIETTGNPATPELLLRAM